MYLAHIAGIPVEETLAYFAPVAGLMLFGFKLKLKRVRKCECCRKRLKCCCTI